MGIQLLIYAGDCDDIYPNRLDEIGPRYELDLEWTIENVEYPGNVKSLAVSEKSVLAYDKALLEQEKSEGTNVLYNDSEVVFLNKVELDELGIIAKKKPVMQAKEQ